MTNEIIHSLMIYYRTYLYRIANTYVFDWESDFLCVSRSGYINEIEIKISRSDFKADAKKVEKHLKLQSGTGMIPHRFYYTTPHNLITADEVPEYAGLIYAPNYTVIKNAPLLHKRDIDLRNTLCDKYYYKWLDAQANLKQIHRNVEKYRNSLFSKELLNDINSW